MSSAKKFFPKSAVPDKGRQKSVSEKSRCFAVNEFDRFGVGDFGESGHGDDVAEIDDDEAAAALDLDVTHIYLETAGNIQQSRII